MSILLRGFFVFFTLIGLSAYVCADDHDVGDPMLMISVVVKRFKENAENTYYLNGTHFINHLSTLQIQRPDKYKGKVIFITLPSERTTPNFWKTPGYKFDAWIYASYLEIEGKRVDWRALKIVPPIIKTDLSPGVESPKVMVNLSVKEYKEKAESFYYSDGSHLWSNITVLKIKGPDRYRGRTMIITHPADENTQNFWKTPGYNFNAWIYESYLKDQENRIDWRALKIVPGVK